MRKLYMSLMAVGMALAANAAVQAPAGWNITVDPSNDAPVKKLKSITMILEGEHSTGEGLFGCLSGAIGEESPISMEITGPENLQGGLNPSLCKLKEGKLVFNFYTEFNSAQWDASQANRVPSISDEGVYTFKVKVTPVQDGDKTKQPYTYVFTAQDEEGNWNKDIQKLLLTDFEFTYTIGDNVGVSEVSTEQAAPVYYDLMGRAIDQPQQGVYVRVQNGKAQKVRL